MLVTFKTSAHGNITMFGDVAKELLVLMGQSGNVPGALLAEDVAQAVVDLQSGLSSAGNDDAPPLPNDDDSAPVPVALKVRAAPLIDLLEAAIADKESVMWDSN